jgi:hypothetical protein
MRSKLEVCQFDTNYHYNLVNLSQQFTAAARRSEINRYHYLSYYQP